MKNVILNLCFFSVCVWYICELYQCAMHVVGQVWCLIVSIPDLCHLSYFYIAVAIEPYNTA